MSRPARAVLLALLLASGTAHAQPFDGCPSQPIAARFDEFSRTGRMPAALGRWLHDARAQYVAPFPVFDNVAFVGVCWVSAWVIRTSEGPVLIDTLHDSHVDVLLENLLRLGIDPSNVRYVLMTHGHFDHAGGAHRLKAAMPRARFAMTQSGWDEAHASVRQLAGTPGAWRMVDTDLVLKDGDEITVGDTTIRVYETPGHTFGTASYEYPAIDGDRRYQAFTVGGLGLNAIRSAAQVEAYIASVRRIERLLERQPDPVSVHLTTHPFSTGLMEAARDLAGHKPGEPHRLVDPAGFAQQLRLLREDAEARLVVERKAGR